MSERDIDVTGRVCFGNPDDESLPLTRCVCGMRFPSWHCIISVYRDDPWQCATCGRRLYFISAVRVMEVHE